MASSIRHSYSVRYLISMQPVSSHKPKAKRGARGFSYVSEPEQDYICPVCLDPFESPISHSACGNVFCDNCVSALTECPMCRSKEFRQQLMPVPKLITNKLEALLVRCNTCGLEQQRSAIQQHLKSHQQVAASADHSAAVIESLLRRIGSSSLCSLGWHLSARRDTRLLAIL